MISPFIFYFILNKYEKEFFGYSTDAFSMFFILLFLNSYITLPMLISLIVLFKIITNNYSLVALMFAILYGYLFYHLNIYYTIAILILFSIVLILLIINKIDLKVYEKIPDWVDPSLYGIITKKQNIRFYLKFISVFLVAYKNMKLFLSWPEFEYKLDHLISLLPGKYDIIVGMKSGGAIMSNYMAKKLNIPYTYIKVATTCKPTYYDSQKDAALKLLNMKINEYSICEDLTYNIEGLNVLLVDECVASGKSITFVHNYLSKAKSVTACTLFRYKVMKNEISIPLIIESSDEYLVFPWGYDN